MKLSEFKTNYVFKTKIELNDEGDYIVLREPNMAEIQQITGKDEAKQLEVLTKLVDSCIVESSFTDDNGNPCSGPEIHKVLKESGTMEIEVVNAWANSLPFSSRLPKKEK